MVEFSTSMSVPVVAAVAGSMTTPRSRWWFCVRKTLTPASASASEELGEKSMSVLKVKSVSCCRRPMNVWPSAPAEFPLSAVRFSFDGARRSVLGFSGGETMYEDVIGYRQYVKCAGSVLPGEKSISSLSVVNGLAGC